LPDGRFAYGRLYRDASVGFYRQASSEPGKPPIGSRAFAFWVAVEQRSVDEWERVGVDPFDDSEDDGWPPPNSIQDPIAAGRWSIYHHGVIRLSSAAEAQNLEPAAVWGEVHLVPRLLAELDRT
jgi:hypothetical protein